MAQTGFTPILLYASSTPSAVPTAGNLTNSASGAELAINYADGRLFYKDNGGVVQTLATKATGTIGGSTTQVQYNLSGALAGSANLTFNGTTLTANALTVSTGNLLFSSTAQRITGDMSNATLANRLAFQTSTANGNTVVQTVPNGTSATSAFRSYNNSDPTNAAFAQASVSSGEVQFTSGITGTGTYLPMTFYTGGSERVRVDTSGNVAVGTTNAGTAGLSLSQGYNLSWEQSATESIANLFRQTSSAALVMSVGYKRSATANGFASSFGSSLAKTAISLGTTAGAITFYTDTAATTAVGTDVTPTERMRIDSSGNVGIGTASPGALFDVGGGGLRVASTGSMTSGNLADAVGYKGTPLNERSANYTLVLADQGLSIVHPITDNNARTFTIPANGTVAFPVGTTITFINMINTVTIAITTDTMYLAGAGTTGSRTLAAYGVATAIKVTSTSWIISGNGLT